MPKNFRTARNVTLLAVAIACATHAIGAPPSPAGAPAVADDIHILQPTINKTQGQISIPGNFWKEDVADWVETALSGRPSDFLHETMICTCTTRNILENAFRQAGFHDADMWVTGVKDFPRVRGDRFIIILEFTADGKKERYSLDELLSFQGWGISIGPYGFMFKGDPGRQPAASAPAAPATEESDRTKILRDDPQIALTFKGLQNMSQSFADHPLAYDNWIYPMMNLGRNYAALSSKILTANADLPVTILFQKVDEETFLTQSAALWHDDAWRAEITRRIPIAREIDRNKADLLALITAENSSGKRPLNTPVTAREAMLINHIDLGYATLDAAWATYAVAHAQFKTTDPQALAALKEQATRWAAHLALTQKNAVGHSFAQDALFVSEELQRKPSLTSADQAELTRLRGTRIEKTADALAADSQQERDYWKEEKSRLDPTDPRSAWIAAVEGHLELITAQESAATAGIALGKALQQPSPENISSLESIYSQALTQVLIAEAHIHLAEIQFEITKHEAFENDPDLPALREKKKNLEADLVKLTQKNAQH